MEGSEISVSLHPLLLYFNLPLFSSSFQVAPESALNHSQAQLQRDTSRVLSKGDRCGANPTARGTAHVGLVVPFNCCSCSSISDAQLVPVKVISYHWQWLAGLDPTVKYTFDRTQFINLLRCPENQSRRRAANRLPKEIRRHSNFTF